MGLTWIRKDETRKGLLDTSNQYIYGTYREVRSAVALQAPSRSRATLNGQNGAGR